MANKAKRKELIIPREEVQESMNLQPIQYDNKELLETYAREAVNQVFKKKGGLGVPIQNLIHLIVSRYKLDIIELIEYTKTTLNEMPDISNKNLAIILLLKVANHSKNKKMARLAKEMLKENWWAKYSENILDDFNKRIIEFFTKQKTKDLIKESLFEILEMIIELYRRPKDDMN